MGIRAGFDNPDLMKIKATDTGALKDYEVVGLKRPGIHGKIALSFQHVPLIINLPVVYIHKI
jgi:hypothetical protein